MDIYIPLSSDSKLWDTDKKIVFIEDCYWMQQDQELLKSIDYEILDVDAFELTQLNKKELWELKKYLASALGKILNEYHHVNFSELYWERILAPWLFKFVEYFYIRFYRLRLLLEKYKNHKLIVNILSEDQRTIPLNRREWYHGVLFSESYTKKIYSDLFYFFKEAFFEIQYDFLPIHAVEKNEEHNNAVDNRKTINTLKTLYGKLSRIRNLHDFISKIKRRFHYICCLLGELFYHKILRVEPECFLFFSGAGDFLERVLVLKTRGRVAAYSKGDAGDVHVHTIPQIDELGRKNFLTKLRQDDFRISDMQFLSILFESIAREIPCSYVENYKECRNVFRPLFAHHPRLRFIISNSGALFLEPLMAMAEQGERGVKYSFMQHGFEGQAEDDLQKVLIRSDIIYTWGRWGDDIHAGVFRMCPSGKLYLYDDIDVVTSQDIVFIGDMISKVSVFCRYHTLNRYYQMIKAFLDTVSGNLLQKFIIRNYPWETTEVLDQILSRDYPSVRFSRDKDPDDAMRSFQCLLASARLIILDHVETPFTEALYINKPFILFFRKDFTQFYFGTKDQKYVDMMYEVGILHYSPESAAKYVNQIYHDVEAWWQEPKRQQVVKILRERYTSPKMDGKQWWYDEIHYLLNHDV